MEVFSSDLNRRTSLFSFLLKFLSQIKNNASLASFIANNAKYKVLMENQHFLNHLKILSTPMDSATIPNIPSTHHFVS